MDNIHTFGIDNNRINNTYPSSQKDNNIEISQAEIDKIKNRKRTKKMIKKTCSNCLNAGSRCSLLDQEIKDICKRCFNSGLENCRFPFQSLPKTNELSNVPNSNQETTNSQFQDETDSNFTSLSLDEMIKQIPDSQFQPETDIGLSNLPHSVEENANQSFYSNFPPSTQSNPFVQHSRKNSEKSNFLPTSEIDTPKKKKSRVNNFHFLAPQMINNTFLDISDLKNNFYKVTPDNYNNEKKRNFKDRPTNH